MGKDLPDTLEGSPQKRLDVPKNLPEIAFKGIQNALASIRAYSYPEQNGRNYHLRVQGIEYILGFHDHQNPELMFLNVHARNLSAHEIEECLSPYLKENQVQFQSNGDSATIRGRHCFRQHSPLALKGQDEYELVFRVVDLPKSDTYIPFLTELIKPILKLAVAKQRR